MRGDRRNNNKGFTLVEAVVSMLILAVVILSIIGGFNIITEANFKAKKIQGANTLYSNISEKLRDATGYDEMDNLTSELSTDFNVGAMKYTAEVSIEGMGEQYKDSNGKVPIDEDAVVTVIKYKVSSTETKNVEVKCDKDGNFYFYPYEKEITGDYWGYPIYSGNYVISTTKSYLTWYNPNSDYYYHNSIDGHDYRAGINGKLEIPRVANIVKSYDNYVYQLNSEDYAKFPVFDSSTKSFLMNYNDLDEINNVYDGEGRNDIAEIDKQSTYSVSKGNPSSKLKGLVNSGDKGRVNTKFIAYKFKKRWYNEIENGKNVTYVEYLIATMVTYNKGVDQYVSPNYYGYDYVREGYYDKYNVLRTSTVYMDWYNRYVKYIINSTSGKPLEYYFAAFAGRNNYNAKAIDFKENYITNAYADAPLYNYNEPLIMTHKVNSVTECISEYVLARGKVDNDDSAFPGAYDSAYGPFSSEAWKQLNELKNVYFFYTPYTEADDGTISATDEKYLNIQLLKDDSWDFTKQFNVYFLVQGRDSTDYKKVGPGYLLKYWTLSDESDKLKYYPFSRKGLITNVNYVDYDETKDVYTIVGGVDTSTDNISRYTGINYSEGNKYNENFTIVPNDATATMVDKSKGVKVKVVIKYAGSEVLEKEEYVYFK